MNEAHALNANAIIKKLKELLQVKTDIQLSEILNVKSNTISTWKKRNSLDFNSIIAVCSHRGIDLNDVFCENHPEASADKPLETLLVNRNVLFQYCIGSAEIIQNLPKYHFPYITTQESRAFQVVSNNMYPLIQENSFVICESTDKNNIFKDNLIVAISSSRGYFIGRVAIVNNEQGHFILASENDIFSTVHLSFNEINELWLVKGILSYTVNHKGLFINISDRLQKIKS